MVAYDCFEFELTDVTALHNNFIPDHDSRCNWKVQFKVRIGHIFVFGFGGNINPDLVLLSQHGDHLLEVLSRLSVRLVEEKADIEHGFLLLFDSDTIILISLIHVSVKSGCYPCYKISKSGHIFDQLLPDPIVG